MKIPRRVNLRNRQRAGCAPRMGPRGFHKFMITDALFLARHGNGRNAAVSSAVSDSKERLWPWRVP